MNKELKVEIERLIDIWIDGVISSSNDAGWTGETILARMIAFGGEIPHYTGLDHSNASMIHAIKLLRPTHHEFPKIQAIVAELVKSHKPAILALLARRYYHHYNEITERSWTDNERAFEVGQSFSQFRRNLLTSYALVARELTKYDAYRNVVS